jgi:ferredoxin-NADP reductase
LDRLSSVEGSGLPVSVQRAPGAWQIATVSAIKQETPMVKSFRLRLPAWVPHMPGQHYDVRLTAPDGYRAQRSYSVASSPLDEGEIELTVDRLDDGEVSRYFHDVLVEDDQVEVRGPFASYFVWRGESPALLVAGGSGVAPLMAMLRHRDRAMPDASMRLLYSLRGPEDVIYADELAGRGDDVVLTYSREAPEGWQGHTGRIDAEIVTRVLEPGATAFVCGSNGFVEAAAGLLLGAGLEPSAIRTERFGPTG